jgi:predicted lipid carrier protein YhbT
MPHGPELPSFVRRIASRLPVFPPSWIAARALALAAPRVVGCDALATVDGLAFRIAVRDAGLAIAFRLRLPRFVPLDPSERVDVSFTADAVDYLRIATREADPDTLFFERRLAIEGDTEAGLRLKNLLDSVELPQLLPDRARCRRCCSPRSCRPRPRPEGPLDSDHVCPAAAPLK